MKRDREPDLAADAVIVNPLIHRIDLATTRRAHWYARVMDSPLHVDMWTQLARLLDVHAHLALSRVCVATYNALGDFVQLANKCVALHEDKYGKQVVDARDLLHDLRWALWSNDWSPMNTFEGTFARTLADLPVTSFLRQMPDPLKWCDHVLVGGGFIRGLLLDTLRTSLLHGHFLAPALSSAYGDVDIWLDDSALDLHPIQSWMRKIITLNKTKDIECTSPKDVNTFMWNIDYQEAQLQLILTSALAFRGQECNKPEANTPLAVINDFDFSCVQMGLTGHWFSGTTSLRGGRCVVSPLALWGLFAGTLCGEDAHPEKTGATFLFTRSIRATHAHGATIPQ